MGQNLRVIGKEKLLEFQVKASQGQNLQFKQPRKFSSRKQHFGCRKGKSSLTSFEADSKGERACCSVYLFIYLFIFIFGCVGPSLLHAGFL